MISEILSEEAYTTVLKDILPSKEKNRVVMEVFKLIQQETTKKVTLGGSFAKNTHIGESFDCDIFIHFSSEEEIKKRTEKVIVQITKALDCTYEKIHGSREYFTFEYKDCIFEIIPVLDISDPSLAQNIMDNSPFHVTFTKEEAEKKDLQNDIRLFKQFLKANDLYGAESYIQGFSGHVTDILILYYNGFENTIKAISSWNTTKKSHIILDYKNYYINTDALFYLNDSKITSQLIVIDPIIKTRNAAAAISPETITKAVAVCKKFLLKPTTAYFTKKIKTIQVITKKYPSSFCIEIEIEPLKTKKDIAFAKAKKALEMICSNAKRNGFTDTTFEWEITNPIKAWIITRSKDIEKKYEQKGPNKDLTDAVTQFKKAHSSIDIVLKNNTYYVIKERVYTSILDAIIAFSKEPHIAQNIETLRILN